LTVGRRGLNFLGWSVSRHFEPDRKRNLFDRRLRRLQGVVKRREGAPKISKAAKNLRLAALAVIKAKRALIDDYPQRDPDGRQVSHLRVEEQLWLSSSVETIVDDYGEIED